MKFMTRFASQYLLENGDENGESVGIKGRADRHSKIKWGERERERERERD